MDKSRDFRLFKPVICIISMVAVSIVFSIAYINNFDFFHPMIIITLIITLILQYIFLRKYFSFRGSRILSNSSSDNLFGIVLQLGIMVLLIPLNIVVLLVLSVIDVFKVLRDSKSVEIS